MIEWYGTAGSIGIRSRAARIGLSVRRLLIELSGSALSSRVSAFGPFSRSISAMRSACSIGRRIRLLTAQPTGPLAIGLPRCGVAMKISRLT